MKILTALTYYRPHYSGLTIYTERLARALAHKGHSVCVLTSQFDTRLEREEQIDDVQVLRMPVLFRLSKGVIMPQLWLRAWKLVKEADIVHLHLPQLDAVWIAFLARLQSKPVLVTYHCDLQLPTGLIHRLANFGSNIANHLTACLADRIVANSQDYIDNSVFLRRYKHKTYPIFPPIIVSQPSAETIQTFRKKHAILPEQKIIGMMGRLATEKGAEYVIHAMKEVLAQYPDARIIHGGQYQNVMGEEKYAEKLQPLIGQLGNHWTFLGVISEEDKAAFFHCCDVLAAPSLNSTESFGMVQMEAMFCGIPAVCFDLPGSRQPILHTGMGTVVPMKDESALAQAIIHILDQPQAYQGNQTSIHHEFAPETIASHYEAYFKELLSRS